jgi:hypothetical protein
MIQFLAKNFQLLETLPQLNNYVLFKKIRKLDSGIACSHRSVPLRHYKRSGLDKSEFESQSNTERSKLQFVRDSWLERQTKGWTSGITSILPHLPPL